jgi:hypothetical protein
MIAMLPFGTSCTALKQQAVLFRTSSHSGGNSVASYGDRCCAGLRVGRRDQTAAPGDSQDCGVMCWVGAETGPAGASDREDLERQIAFQKAAIQAIALTGRFGEMPAAPAPGAPARGRVARVAAEEPLKA